MGGKDEDSNYVLLTSKEHVMAHLLLHQIYPNNLKILFAAIIMTSVNRKIVSLRTSSYLREECKKKQILKYKKLRDSSTDGYCLSVEIRKKMSISKIGHIISNETKIKISNTEKRKFVSLDVRKKTF